MPFIVSAGTEIEVNVKLDEKILDASEYEAAFIGAMDGIIAEAKSFWETEAGRRLTTSRQQYQEAITGNVINGVGILRLEGDFLPYAVEVGTPGFSMRRGFVGKVIPLNLSRQAVFSSPDAYRQGNGAEWDHPGFPGVRILDTVMHELEQNIIPEHITKALGGM